MKILFLVPYPIEGASVRYRVVQYLPYLERNGIQCEVSPFVTSEFYRILYKKGHYLKKIFYFFNGCIKRLVDFFKALRSDIIFIHLEAFPFGPPVFEWLLSKFNKKIIYDLDDAIYLGMSSSANKFLKILKFPSKIKKIIRLSRHIITTNRYLAEYARKFNRNVTVIQTSIDTERFKPCIKDINNKELTIGWIGSHTTAPYLDLIRNVFYELAKKYHFNLRIVGAGHNINITNVNVLNSEWRLENELEQFQSLDIGVYPLPENQWTLGKAGFKAIQYMSVGVPCAVSKVGINTEIIKDGINGYLVETEKEWIERLARLIENPALRESFSREGRRTVEERFSVKVNAPRYLDIINSIYYESERRKDKKIKILYLVTDLDIGGTSKVLRTLVENLNISKYDILICSLKERGRNSVADDIERLGFRIVFLNAKKNTGFVTLFRLHLLIKDERPDILHTWLFHGNIFGKIVGRLNKCKVVSSIRVKEMGRICHNLIELITSPFAEYHIVNSHTLYHFLEKIGFKTERLKIITNCVDSTIFDLKDFTVVNKIKRELGCRDIVVTMVAKCRKQKAIPVFLKCAKIFKDKGAENISFLFVGDGPLEESLKRKARSFKLGKMVNFLGYRKDIAEILAITDIWVSTTLYEGQSNALLEAMAAKKPIITTDIPENREVVRDGKEALLVPPKDPYALACAIERLASDRVLAERLAGAAYKRVINNYRVESLAEGHGAFYDRLINKGGIFK